MSPRSPTRKRPAERSQELSILPDPRSALGQHYFYVTMRYWPSLAFVLPMLLFFEIGVWLRHGHVVGAHTEFVATYLVERMVNLFGARGFSLLPGLLTVAILLACHLVARHPWKFDIWVLPGMLGESLIWTIPLFVMDRVLVTALAAGAGAEPLWIDKVIRSFGVGIYEEMVFRFIAMNLLHLLMVDLMKLPRAHSNVAVIVLSALIFAAMHHPPLGAEPFDSVKFLFRTAAGLYLAGLFFFRGFGIAAGCHCFYNIIVVTLEAVRS
jgi:hypothetical protein